MPRNSLVTKKKKVFLFLAVFLIAAAGAVLFLLHHFPAERRKDYQRISSESYDSLFLSMYPVTNYEEEPYTHYRGYHTLIADYCIPNVNVLEAYLKRAAKSGNTITTIYLGLLPDKLDTTQLLPILEAYPSVSFEIVLPYPSMDYWLELSHEECTSTLMAYEETISALIGRSNLSLYFFGNTEWLVCNASNYEDDFLTNKDISLKIMLNSDRDHGYMLTAENAASAIPALSALIEEQRSVSQSYPNLEDWTVVFFGDSVIGNFADSASIPGVLGGLTGARVYNCGYGGNSAAREASTPIALPGIAEAFIAGDLSVLPPDTQLYAGMSAYLQDAPENSQLCFVISYGLNDYFSGYPVNLPDAYDEYSYSGAIRTAVASLKEAYPDAVILLCTPNFTSYFANGTEPKSEQGGILTDYVNAVLALSEELGVTAIDNYYELGIHADNHLEYLSDGCHPNEKGRFLMGEYMALKLMP